MANVLLTIAIFLSVWMGTIVTISAIHKQNIPALNLILLAAGLTGVITHFIGMW